jgi:copper chaperone CopZ
MKKQYSVQNLDCANCAQRMENAIKKIGGVTDASLSFLMQKLTVEAGEEGFEKIMDKILKACKKIEPDFKILV